MTATADDVLGFWFEGERNLFRDCWFKGKTEAYDNAIRARFADLPALGRAGALDHWAATPMGALALVIALDQFPRNMFRDSARAFAADPLAREVATRAIARGFDQKVALAERSFFYLPFEHSEQLADQERCVALNRASGDADALEWAELHADIIRRFGRFPHRNAVLGRATTPEEQAFLDSGGFAG